MKMTLPPRAAACESVARPGFDVLMAVTGARQAASPTARRVAANRPASPASGGADQRRTLLARGQAVTGGAARFADLAPIIADPARAGHEALTEMNGLFTRAFQPMVKDDAVDPMGKAGCCGGTGPGMK
jgi:hypothetical protein